MKKYSISVILPIHKMDEDYRKMFDNAVESVEKFHEDVILLIVCPNYVKNEILTSNVSQKLKIKYIVNSENTDFCSQVNLGINECDTEWFSILEIDDEYKPIWLKSMNEYIKEFKDVDVFLPIIKDINTKGEFLTFTNESVWAYGFSNEQGFMDNEVLQEFQNFQTSGGLYKTEIIKKFGLFKENIKVTFSYEFLLRLTYNKVKIMTVPRIGYQHVNFREDSLFHNYKNDEKTKVSENEVKFWLDAAKKEYFFKNKRDINYVES